MDRQNQVDRLISGDIRSSVCRIKTSSNGESWEGTGFLFVNDAILTNAHVIPNKSALRNATFQFGDGKTFSGTDVKFAIISRCGERHFNGPDMTIISLSRSDADAGTSGLIRLIEDKQFWLKDKYYLVHHGGGVDPASIDDSNDGVRVNCSDIIHRVRSGPGSSGAPLLNADGIVVGLHHSKLRTGEKAAVYIEEIRRFLEAAKPFMSGIPRLLQEVAVAERLRGDNPNLQQSADDMVIRRLTSLDRSACQYWGSMIVVFQPNFQFLVDEGKIAANDEDFSRNASYEGEPEIRYC